MIFEQLTTDHFKGLPNRKFSFSEGITLVVGPNRAGKSSLHQALLTALFGLGKEAHGLASEWQQLLRWGFSEGSLLLQYQTSAGRYRVERVLGGPGAELKEERDGEWNTVARASDEVTDKVLAHIGIDSAALFARTVSVAQGDLSRLETRDHTEIGRALEEVLIGRSGATLEEAMKYLDQAVRKPLRRKDRRETAGRVDDYQREATDLQTEIEGARKREKDLHRLRETVKELQAKVPEKEKRLEELTGDPEQDQALGLLTKHEQKRKLEDEKTALTEQTRDLQATVKEVNELQDSIDELEQQLTADGSLRQQDLGQVEAELSALEKALAGAKKAVEGCDERIKDANGQLEEVDSWFEAHPGFRDHAHKVKDAESAIGTKRELEKRLRTRENELEEFGQEMPKVVLPVWELVLGVLILLTPILAASLTNRWGAVWASVVGVGVLVDYTRRAIQGTRLKQAFFEGLRVKQALTEGLQGDVQEAEGTLSTALQLLGISEEQPQRVLSEYRSVEANQKHWTGQLDGERTKKSRAERQNKEATSELRRFCQQFALECAEDLREQISLVRRLRKAQGTKDDLLDDRTLDEIQDDLDENSVKLRAVRKELEFPEYADFSPTTEEIEGWRRETESLKKEVPKLKEKLIKAQQDVKNREDQAEGEFSSHELEGRLEWLQEQIECGDRTVEACYEAHRLLREVQEEHRTTYLPRLEEATSAHLKRMTEGFYSAVNLAACWPDITAAEASNKAVPPDELSGGSRDQLYFAFRLAVADQIGAEETLPLLLDEPFANFDSEHWHRTLDILTDLGTSGRQVIYFSMRHEVERLLSRRAVGRFPLEAIHLPNDGVQPPIGQANSR